MPIYKIIKSTCKIKIKKVRSHCNSVYYAKKWHFYCKMQLIYVNMRDNNINMQDLYVNVQDT